MKMKYPKTSYLPWSPEHSDRDERLSSVKCFEGKEVIYYEKLDGENTCLAHDEIHARALGSYNKKWQTSTKAYWNIFRHDIPEGMFIFAENMYATHSIEYNRLKTTLHVFNIWYEGTFLSADDVAEWASLLGLQMVPTIHRRDEIKMLEIPPRSSYGDSMEGYVVRNMEAFTLEDFNDNVAKSVRKGHVQTDQHWTRNWSRAKIIYI
jgi:hypothetical protein